MVWCLVFHAARREQCFTINTVVTRHYLLHQSQASRRSSKCRFITRRITFSSVEYRWVAFHVLRWLHLFSCRKHSTKTNKSRVGSSTSIASTTTSEQNQEGNRSKIAGIEKSGEVTHARASLARGHLPRTDVYILPCHTAAAAVTAAVHLAH